MAQNTIRWSKSADLAKYYTMAEKCAIPQKCWFGKNIILCPKSADSAKYYIPKVRIPLKVLTRQKYYTMSQKYAYPLISYTTPVLQPQIPIVI